MGLCSHDHKQRGLPLSILTEMVKSSDPTSIRDFYPIDSFGLGTLAF